MFGELPKLFGRDFAVGYFLPFAAFLATNLGLITGFGLSVRIVPYLQTQTLVGVTLLGLISWLGGIVLLALNRSTVSLFEGYGYLNPARLLAWIQRRQFDRLRLKLSALEKEYESCTADKREFPEKLRSKRMELMIKAAERFPDERQWLLPTALGNTIRAFEVYPRVMYGIEDIEAWNRLLAVIPTDYRELVDASKAQVDFRINLCALGILICVEYVGLVLYTGHVSIVWLLVLVILVVFVCNSRASSAASEWGNLVKAAYDVFMPALRTTLQFRPRSTWEQERQVWTAFSQAIIYRLPSSLPDRVSPEPPADNGTSVT